ncbi:ECF transporter S component [Brevibacillus fluminis]|uniref:ECF transporter S component n=1 Tax=Brevibacillus fluminis TaxID=511487 RepID=UPI003470EB39
MMAQMNVNQKMPSVKKGFWTPRRVARLAIVIALSAVGGFIKIPSPTGTVALDSAPGFFAAVAFGPIDGAIVGGVGHLFTAATTGFPMGLPLHLFVALQQAVWAVLFWLVARKVNLWVGVIAAVICNGVIAPALFIPIGGVGLFLSLLLPLTVGSAINIIISAIAYKIVKKSNMV